MNSADQDNAS